MTDTNKIYEVLDISNEGYCLMLGIYLDIETAKQELLKRVSEDNALTEESEYFYNDPEIIAIRQRPIGWTDDFKDVFTLKREKQYNEQTDEYKWVTIDEKHNP